MFDISTINKRFFHIKIDGLELDVEPPKIKVLKKILSLSNQQGEQSIDKLSEAISLILSKNKSNYKVSEDIIDELDIDQYKAILTEYFKWIAVVKNSPN
ncbi:hypothetical protein [Clostridium sp. BNL1100]|uniref:hypothetical protein n=1 Tax=Clostridium sp. BNL1100 TaxID=755731 RepID=UPI00024A78CD|nr:hypothetical protein [Clostridium sp. BNL1100]AEY64832.1 hypothetical protein Clo1100_0553 [Clostridium sp. BNL1100]